MTKVQHDFDRIALLTPDSEALGPHEAAVLRENLPAEGDRALDLGCGTGVLARKLARSFRTTIGIDFSVAMAAAAKRQSAHVRNLHFVAADAVAYLQSTPSSFDCITAFAVLHHLDLVSVVPSLVTALRPGGLLLIVDLIDRSGVRHLPVNGVAWLMSQARRRPGGNGRPSELNAAWHAHGESEQYMTFAEARRQYARLLPDARVRQHLLWRYSLVWRKTLGTRPLMSLSRPGLRAPSKYS